MFFEWLSDLMKGKAGQELREQRERRGAGDLTEILTAPKPLFAKFGFGARKHYQSGVFFPEARTLRYQFQRPTKMPPPIMLPMVTGIRFFTMKLSTVSP